MVDRTFAHRDDDLIAVSEWVAARDDLDADRLFVYGHSEGTAHAMAAAAAVPEVDAMILLAGCGRRGSDEVPLQGVRLLTSLGYPEEVIDASRAYVEAVASYGEEIHRPYQWYGAVVGDIIAWLDAR